jgi:nitric oxide reductase subunit C
VKEETTVDGRKKLGIVATATLLLGAGTLPVQAGSAPEIYDKKCKLCHSIAGDAGKQADKGGPLDDVGSKRDAAWLEKYMRDPKSVMPDAKMPKLKYTDEEMKILVDYMLSLK